MSPNPDFLLEIKKYTADRIRFNSVSRAVLLLAIVFPVIVITAFPKLYHSSDVDDLWRWSRSWDADWKNIYLDYSRCNYPFWGTFASAGIISLSGIKNFGDIVMPFRYCLGIIDGVINVGLKPNLSLPIIPYNLGMVLFSHSVAIFFVHFLMIRYFKPNRFDRID